MASDAYAYVMDDFTCDWQTGADDQLEGLARKPTTTSYAEISLVPDSRRALNRWLAARTRYASAIAATTGRCLPLQLESRLSELMVESELPGWDGERGLPVDRTAWDDARAILRSLPEAVLTGPELNVSMSGDGYVHITLWREGKGRATVEAGHGRYFWTWVRGLDESDNADLASLTEATSKLARFISN